MSDLRPAPLRIGPIELANRVSLAPMSGISDLPFRRIARRLGAGLVFSEMVASDRLVAGEVEAAMKAECAGIAPRAVQLAGCRAGDMAEAARMVESNGADLIDINMGCPAKRVVGGLAGSALMRDLDHAVGLIRAVRSAVSVPVTVKMRLGWDHASINAPELARRAEAEGISLVTVHGRTRQQFYKGEADWDAIRPVVEAVSIPVIANGDCADAAGARDMLARSGASGVMVGRAATGRPWLPGAIAAALDDGGEVRRPREAGALMLELAEATVAHYGAEIGVRCVRKHLTVALTDVAGDGTVAERPGLRRAILTEDDPGRLLPLVEAWFAETPEELAA
ncbi:tRNA dihydrouridine synthase DusB [Amorphus orientalis]|uniref:tRNA-dihydrouridine synthase n=1 Tax=Amorphus orientalis TaxID=649198 RepID=A0AAE4AUY2_9HYPH|nr:tRNA dihydrouridine synthase DusB [Amorphus orientalis]MDQ0317652.1 nifR3 family TIM-barrel protein [Amorphus orientalis]